MISAVVRRGAVAVSLTLAAFLLIAATDEPAGYLWESKSQPVMEGMPFPMPAQTVKICAAREWTRPPEGNPNCTSSNFVLDGNKATWTVACTGDMPMTGEGEMTFDGEDAYSGTVKLNASGMKMTINLTGRKVGTCDNPQ